jgi:hypothetical protein
MHRLPVLALALFLSTGWWGDVLRSTAAVLGLDVLTAAEQSTAPPPPANPTTDAGCEWDPLGRCLPG